MANTKKFFRDIIHLKFVVELACFICICVLCGLSAKNPFKNHIIGDLSNYFTDVNNNTNSNLNTLKNLSINHIKEIKGKLFNKYKKLSQEKVIKRKAFLRQLVSKSFCSGIRDNFIEFKGQKLSNIFELNYEKILHLSIPNLVVSCVLLAIILLFSAFLDKIDKWNKSVIKYIFRFAFVLYVARFVLSIILFYYIEKGDIEEYDDFLDCKNVRKKYFAKFSDINKLRKCFLAFFILNIIVQGIDKIQNCFENLEKLEEGEKYENKNEKSSIETIVNTIES